VIRGTERPQSNNNAGAEDPKERFEGQDSPHSNNNAGAEDLKDRFERQEPALEYYEGIEGPTKRFEG
jgi:hypothetical protein